jgi:hypothetical protein
VEWLLTLCTTEDEAKARASEALIHRLRFEAGTIPGVESERRIGWRAAHDWARSPNAGAIVSLRRGLNIFAGRGAPRIRPARARTARERRG